MRRTETPKPIWIKFGAMVDITDIVTYTNFGDHQLRSFWVAGDQISPYPIDFHRRPYNISNYDASVRLKSNRKSYALYQMAPLPMTSSER